MIELRELKAGNWVTPYKEACQIEFVDGSSVKLRGIDTFMPLTKDSIHPIPFTTEWAQRFGLIGKVLNGLCISESEYQGHEYDLCLYDEHTWDSERRVICPIYYVHQCQNIFLDLAGHIIE